MSRQAKSFDASWPQFRGDVPVLSKLSHRAQPAKQSPQNTLSRKPEMLWVEEGVILLSWRIFTHEPFLSALENL